VAAQNALMFARASVGERHPNTIYGLNELGRLYTDEGRYAEAEPLLAQALQLSRAMLLEYSRRSSGSQIAAAGSPGE
jgi:Tetratricopeptide repeat